MTHKFPNMQFTCQSGVNKMNANPACLATHKQITMSRLAGTFCVLVAAVVVISSWAYDHQEFQTYKAHHSRMYRSVSQEESWANFNAKYGKQYRSASEAATRKATFLKNLETIHDNHAKYERGLVRHFLGVTELADMDQQELENSRGTGLKIDPHLDNVNEEVVIGGLSDPPSSFDWNEKGKVTSIKDQGACGSCWAYAAMAVLESQALIKDLGLEDLSEQHLVDCFDKACDGSDSRAAFLWLINQPGAVSEASYPADERSTSWGMPGVCHAGTPVQKVYRMGQLRGPLQDNDLKNYIMTRGPVAISVESKGWPGPGTYVGGVIEQQTRGPSNHSWTNAEKEALKMHAVVAVGWGQEPDGQEYWIIKNSWGPFWGYKGFGRIGMGSDKDSGVTTYSATYATVVPGNDNDAVCRLGGEPCMSDSDPNCCFGSNAGVDPDLKFFCTCMSE